MGLRRVAVLLRRATATATAGVEQQQQQQQQQQWRHCDRRAMSIFKQVLNPLLGQSAWEAKDDDYDYHQEVANAGFGDMLHDTERNRKYYAALRKTIGRMHAAGRAAHVLDIGTGTGILAMMAVAAGADTVTACEAFLPMANCAEQIIAANGMRDRIRLVKKRSTELAVGADLPAKANLLVTEVLDTELIGEGAIGIYNHAHDHLLTDDAICIPARASCYAQLVQSPLAAQWNTLKLLASLDGDVLLQPLPQMQQCRGEADLHDMQLSQLPAHQYRPLAAPLEIFQFDFTRKQPRETERTRNLAVRATVPGSTDMVLYWWDIKMDADAEILLSCAPYWAHPEIGELAAATTKPLPNAVPWRDHWMQAIYHIPRPLHLYAPGEEFLLSCNHDEYSLWFDVMPKATTTTTTTTTVAVPRHSCTCNLHRTFARSRIAQLNQSVRNKRYLRYLEQAITPDAHVLVLSDGSLLGLAAAKLGAARVHCHEPHRTSQSFLADLVQHNELANVRIVEQLESLLEDDEALREVTHVFAEPYFVTSILPWDNFYFGTLLQRIREQLPANAQIAPHAARVYAVPVEFLDLHKIRTPVGACEGFDLSLFDKMVDSSMRYSQDDLEAQPLWEYPCRALAQPQPLLEVVFRNFAEDKAAAGHLNIDADGSCNGIAVWVDWQLAEDAAGAAAQNVVSSGPTAPVVPGEYIQWDMFVRQGVQLLGRAQRVQRARSRLSWAVDFQPLAGRMKFTFDVQPQ